MGSLNLLLKFNRRNNRLSRKERIIMFNHLSEISFVGPIVAREIIDLSLFIAPNAHAYVHIEFTFEESQEYDLDSIVNQHVEIKAKDETIFCGLIGAYNVSFLDVYSIRLVVFSHTIELDIKSKRRSFQNKNQSYKRLFENIVKKEYNGDVFDVCSKGKTLNRVVIQYDETDWAFLTRMASYLDVALYPDILSHKPKLYIGIPNGEEIQSENFSRFGMVRTLTESKGMKLNSKLFSTVKEISEIDFTAHALTSDEFYPVGTEFLIQGATYKIIQCTLTTSNQIISKVYVMQKYEGCKVKTFSKESFTGLVLFGEILQMKNDKIQVCLDIDKDRQKDEKNAYWFPMSTFYASQGGTGMYVMSEKGERVSLYFSDAYDTQPIIKMVHRRNTQQNPQMKNTDNKYFSNQSGRSLQMSKKELSFTINPGSFFLNFDDSQGVHFESNEEIQLHSQENLNFQGTNIQMQAGNEILLESNGSSLVLDNITHIKGGRISQLGIPIFQTIEEKPLETVTSIQALDTTIQDEPVAASAKAVPDTIPAPIVKKKGKNKAKEQQKTRVPTIGIMDLEKESDFSLYTYAREAKLNLPIAYQIKFNLSCAKVELESNAPKYYLAHSSISHADILPKESPINQLGKMCYLSGDNNFKTLQLDYRDQSSAQGWNRNVDSESKVLEGIHNDLKHQQKPIKGKISLYTELDPCPSCSDVIQQFSKAHPMLQLDVVYRKVREDPEIRQRKRDERRQKPLSRNTSRMKK